MSSCIKNAFCSHSLRQANERPAARTTPTADPNAPASSEIAQSSTVSECGGFPQPTGSGTSGYCDAEVLGWSYDAAGETLALVDSRIELNCCGVRSSKLEKRGDGYVLTQTDAPEVFDGQEARCGCTCVFDFALEAQQIPQGVISLEVVRNVTDDAAGPTTVFQGSIDLAQQSGQIDIDTTPSEWCQLDSGPSAS